MSLRRRIAVALLFALSLAAYVASDHAFAPLDDETEFVTLARQPLAQSVDDYLHGNGHPEHPPLGEWVLHAWMPVGGAALWSLRLPSVLFFLAGLLFVAQAARRLGGERAFIAAVALGVAWPFAFHFARVADWYSLAFMLVAALTLAYLRYVDEPRPSRGAAFVAVAILLVWTTYYGWAIVACLAADLVRRRGLRDSAQFLLVALGALALAYAPLWRVFAAQLARAAGPAREVSPLAHAANAAYNGYALFVSESVAPWHWYASVPAAVAIVASLILAWRLLAPPHRLLLAGFALLFAGLALFAGLNTKRLLFVSPWLLLALALALANRERPRARRALALSLALAAAVGWGGTLARTLYAAPHFVEPWAAIAQAAADVAAGGGKVVTNSMPLLFEMSSALHARGQPASADGPRWVEHPAVVNVAAFTPADAAGIARVLLVRGVNIDLEVPTAAAQAWLDAHCKALGGRELVPDSGYAIKQRLFPAAGQRPYRITLREYDCAEVAGG